MSPEKPDGGDIPCPACGATIPGGESRCSACGKGRPASTVAFDDAAVSPADLEWGPRAATGSKLPESPRRALAIVAGALAGLVLFIAWAIIGFDNPSLLARWPLLILCAILLALIVTTIARADLRWSGKAHALVPPRRKWMDVLTITSIFLQSLCLAVLALFAVALALVVAFFAICTFTLMR